MKRTLIGLLLWSVSAVWPAFGEGMFAELKFDDACAQAKKDGKIVLIDFYTTWCGPCKMLDKNTWTDTNVIKLLTEKTVPLKLDAEKETNLAKLYKIEAYPTILLLKPEGSEIDRIVGYKDPKAFQSDFDGAISGKDSIARAREKVEKAGGKDPISRTLLANELMQKHKDAEALEEYLWCFDHGAEASPGYAGVRVSFLLSYIVRLGKKYPPALEALQTRRDQAEAKVRDGSADQNVVYDVLRLNDALGEKQKDIALFDELPPDNKSRSLVAKEIPDQLVSAKRYPNALEGVDAIALFDQQVKSMEGTLAQLAKGENAAMRDQIEPNMRKNAVGKGLIYFEALAGAKKNEEATALAEKILKLDGAAATRDKLIQAARRADNLKVWDELKSKGEAKTAAEK